MKIARFYLILATLLLAITSLAQEPPKAEVFGGYSFRTQGDMNIANGWDASVSANLNRWLGAVGDFSGYYRSDHGTTQRNYNFLFGPKVTYRRSSLSPFGQILFGAAHQQLNASSTKTTDNAFAMAVGGGVDYGFNQHFSARLLQADYLLTRFGGSTQNTARVSFGIVLKLGNK